MRISQKNFDSDSGIEDAWLAQTLVDSAYPLSKPRPRPQALLGSRTPNDSFDVVNGEVLIDVTDTCSFNVSTGIQRVTRNLVRELKELDRPFRLVCWNSKQTGLRNLTNDEYKVATGIDVSLGRDPVGGLMDTEAYRIIAPVGCKILIAELATQTGRVKRTIALAKFSNNAVYSIGFDAVPVIMPSTASLGMISAYVWQMGILKYSKSIFCISSSSSFEFKNLFKGLASQGITTPEILSVPLPVAAIGSSKSTHTVDPTVKKFLVVGSHEPRKNHEMILASAELLWQAGNNFELHFVGSRGWKSDFFWNMFSDLKKRNRPLYSHIGIDDKKLQDLYASSNAVISVSHHEGYGLPIAEAIGFERPVITVNLGSQGELAKEFSLETIDSLDVVELASEMAKFLSNQVANVDPPTETDHKKFKYPLTWKEYAQSIWKHLEDS